jgi:hypothetical protein
MPPGDNIWLTAERAVVAGDANALERLLREHTEMFRDEPPQSSWLGGLAPDYASADARSILAREHCFASFAELTRHLETLRRKDSAVAVFELAVDAVVAGDAPALERLLQDHPELVHARSSRAHRATLLHYVGANGVEGWRQRTPANAVAIAELLLSAGAEVDALADMYGGSTTLGLVATSIHPLRAGVQNDLMQSLLDHGAAMDLPGTAGRGQNIINGCLANGRPGAAEFLAARGARLDLEGAAGVGALEVVRGFFESDGRLKAAAIMDQAKSGFQWACEYGRKPVVEFLLQQKIAVNELHRGQTGLHWAAYSGHVEIVKLLLRSHPDINLRDERFDSTPLGWALHGWADSRETVGNADYYTIVSALVVAGATVELKNIPREALEGDPRMAAALRQGDGVGPSTNR